MTHVGIDFGAKKAGTTVICAFRDSSWYFSQCPRGTDADAFLEKEINVLSPGKIFIDAPLSLPQVYSESNIRPEADYHYRECDRLSGAMSPMFLGGLTARAIRLRSIWEQNRMEVFETYPKLMARELETEDYKKDINKFCESVHRYLNTELPALSNWHQADACLAWLSGLRYIRGNAHAIGNKAEGLIIV